MQIRKALKHSRVHADLLHAEQPMHMRIMGLSFRGRNRAKRNTTGTVSHYDLFYCIYADKHASINRGKREHKQPDVICKSSMIYYQFYVCFTSCIITSTSTPSEETSRCVVVFLCLLFKVNMIDEY